MRTRSFLMLGFLYLSMTPLTFAGELSCAKKQKALFKLFEKGTQQVQTFHSTQENIQIKFYKAVKTRVAMISKKISLTSDSETKLTSEINTAFKKTFPTTTPNSEHTYKIFSYKNPETAQRSIAIKICSKDLKTLTTSLDAALIGALHVTAQSCSFYDPIESYNVVTTLIEGTRPDSSGANIMRYIFSNFSGSALNDACKKNTALDCIERTDLSAQNAETFANGVLNQLEPHCVE